MTHTIFQGNRRRHFLRTVAATAVAGCLPLAARAQKQVVLKVGDQTRTIQSLLESAGLLNDLPYKLEFVQFPVAAPVMEALNAGALDIGYGGDAATTFSLAAGNPSRIVAAYRSDPSCIATIVPQNSPLKTVADLVGKRVAVTRGSVGHLLLVAALTKNGVALDKVDFHFLQPADAYSAFTSGAVDAWSIWTIYVARAVLNNGARILVDGKGLVNNTAYQTARTESLASKRAEIADYVRRVAQARLWALANLDQYAKVWAPMIGATPELARYAYNMEKMTPVLIDKSIVADQQKLVEYYASLKVIPKPFEIAPYFDFSFNQYIQVKSS